MFEGIITEIDDNELSLWFDSINSIDDEIDDLDYLID